MAVSLGNLAHVGVVDRACCPEPGWEEVFAAVLVFLYLQMLEVFALLVDILLLELRLTMCGVCCPLYCSGETEQFTVNCSMYFVLMLFVKENPTQKYHV